MDPILLCKPSIIIDSKLIFSVRIVFVIIITVRKYVTIASIIAIINTQFLIAMTKTQRNCNGTMVQYFWPPLLRILQLKTLRKI